MIATQDLIETTRLRYGSDEEPGIRRVRRGKGFSYHRPDGSLVEDEGTKESIRRLAIPPAWTEVWIARDANSHILATGRDDAGRKQYIYHPEWERLRDEVKYERVAEFGEVLPGLRKQIDTDLRARGLGREKVVALVAAVMDRTLIRVGNRSYAEENDSYGLTTLRADHAEVGTSWIRFEFSGKGGAEHNVALRDPRLARLVAKCQELDGQTLFAYPENGSIVSVSSTDVNQYLRERTGGDYTAKDFRTWGGTVTVATTLAKVDPAAGERDRDRQLLEGIDRAAEKLGNTRAVCRSAYLHPQIPEAFHSGELRELWRATREGRWADRGENLVRRLLR